MRKTTLVLGHAAVGLFAALATPTVAQSAFGEIRLYQRNETTHAVTPLSGNYFQSYNGDDGTAGISEPLYNASADTSSLAGKIGGKAAIAGTGLFPDLSDPDIDLFYNESLVASAEVQKYDLLKYDTSLRFTANFLVLTDLALTYQRDPYTATRALKAHLVDPWTDQLVGQTSVGFRFFALFSGARNDSFLDLYQRAQLAEYVDGDGSGTGTISARNFGNDRAYSETNISHGSGLEAYLEFIPHLNESPFDPLAGPYLTGLKYSFEVQVIAGEYYNLFLYMGCGVGLSAGSLFAAGNSASCEASRSAYWNGMTNVTDLFGNPVSDFQVSSASGFNYRYASPFSPNPANPAPGVPEPSQWALFIMGFGLVGGAARRRRGMTAA